MFMYNLFGNAKYFDNTFGYQNEVSNSSYSLSAQISSIWQLLCEEQKIHSEATSSKHWALLGILWPIKLDAPFNNCNRLSCNAMADSYLKTPFGFNAAFPLPTAEHFLLRCAAFGGSRSTYWIKCAAQDANDYTEQFNGPKMWIDKTMAL